MNYVRKFLDCRHCEFRNKITCGVAQGDSNSSLLFCLGINCVIIKLSEKYTLIVYADDFLIGHSPLIDYRTVIEECKVLLAEIGLTVNILKCKTTQNNGTIKFVG